MDLETYFKNPSDRTTQSARRPPASDDTPIPMADTGAKVAGLAKKGAAIAAGQVGATVITNQALKLGGRVTAPGTIGNTAGAIGLPMLIGAVVLGFSKKDTVQMAGFGCLTAGVAAATDRLLKENRPQFFPGDAGVDYGAGLLDRSGDAVEADPLAGWEPLMALPPATGSTIQLVSAKQL